MSKTKQPFIFSDQVHDSRRGKYKRAILEEKVLEWEPIPLGENKRDKMVRSEIEHAQNNVLAEHPYWFDESEQFIENYTIFYKELFGLNWLGDRYSRNNIVMNKYCCLTSVQYHDGILHAYSRSTDMRNGYYSDKKVLEHLAEMINAIRPDCKVEKIRWYLACPHVYIKEGIARRKT